MNHNYLDILSGLLLWSPVIALLLNKYMTQIQETIVKICALLKKLFIDIKDKVSDSNNIICFLGIMGWVLSSLFIYYLVSFFRPNCTVNISHFIILLVLMLVHAVLHLVTLTYVSGDPLQE